MDETFGMVLRRLRHALGQTLEEVAEATGISVAMLSRAERDQRMPSPETIEALAAYYAVPPEVLEGHAIYTRSRQGSRPQSRAWAARMMQRESAPAADQPQILASRAGWDASEDGSLEMHSLGLSPRAARAQGSVPEAASLGFSARPIEDLFPAQDPRESLSDATRVAEVALAAAMRAVERAAASGDPEQEAEAERALARLRGMLLPGG